MIDQPLISIIIPCYNAAKYIDACINSVIAQNYKNWEAILINDGSKDDTLELLQHFQSKDKRFKVFSQDNAGLSATRNKGIDNANGEFIYFLDSDDVLATHAIATLISAYKNNDIITGVTVTSSFSNGEIKKESQLLHPKEGNITFENNHFQVLIRTLETGLTPVAQNRLYRKDFINKHQLRFKNEILHEDELWFFETMLYAKDVKFINEETYFYRVDNQDSITKNVGDKNLESYILVMQEILKKYAHHQQYDTIANWYAVYIKKIFLDFAIRERSKLNDASISNLEKALKESKIILKDKSILSKNNEIYYKTINALSLQNFNIIKKYFFINPVNSIRKIVNVIKISYFLK